MTSRLHLAGLVQDLGKIAVPYRVLEDAGDDTGGADGQLGSSALAEPVLSMWTVVMSPPRIGEDQTAPMTCAVLSQIRGIFAALC